MSEAVIKINPSDPPSRRARDIEEGIRYACVLLMDEYGWPACEIISLLARTSTDLYDEAARREAS